MLTLETRPSREQLNALAYKMREADRKEVFASSGEDGVTSLHESWESSPGSYLFYWNEVPVAAAGIAPLTQTIGVPWLLCSDAVEDIPNATFWRASRALIKHWQETYHVLTNYVDVRNKTSRAWLRRLGFEEKEEIPFGHLQLPFIRFEKNKCANQPRS